MCSFAVLIARNLFCRAARALRRWAGPSSTLSPTVRCESAVPPQRPSPVALLSAGDFPLFGSGCLLCVACVPSFQQGEPAAAGPAATLTCRRVGGELVAYGTVDGART